MLWFLRDPGFVGGSGQTAYVDILTDEQHRALAFIGACSNRGYAPTPDEVQRWLTEPSNPIADPYAAMIRIAHAANVIYPGSVTDQLVRLRWVYRVEARSRLLITALGQALLEDAEEKVSEALTSATVVLGSDDALSYAALMSELAAAGAGLLVDPYVRREQLTHVVADTSLTRLLVSRKIREDGLAAMRSFLGYVPDARGLEVRVASEAAAHDRYLMNEDGEVFTIGSSLNMVASRSATTVFTPVPRGSLDVFTKLLEDHWATAEPLRPDRTTTDTPSEEAGDAAAAERAVTDVPIV